MAKLKSPPILFLDSTVEVSYGDPWPIRQTKCSPICVCCLIAKLNVRQMYHLYGTTFFEMSIEVGQYRIVGIYCKKNFYKSNDLLSEDIVSTTRYIER